METRVSVPSPSLTHQPKIRKNRVRRRSFTEALKEKYCSQENWDTERYAFPIIVTGKPPNKDGDPELGFLKNVVLDKSCVALAGIPDDGLASLCPNVVDLDLAFNLIESWDEVIRIFSELHHLKFINLSANKIKKNEVFECWNQNFPSIENVVLNSTDIPWDDVTKLAGYLPHLRELHVCNNGYTKLSDNALEALHGVECLRLNNNRITRWDEIWKLSSLPNLNCLILSGNPLLDIFYRDQSQTCSNDFCHCGEGTEDPKNDNIEQMSGNKRNDSESSIGSIDKELRDIQGNTIDSDGEDIPNEADTNCDENKEDDDDCTIAEQCNSFVEDVMLRVLGQMLHDGPEKDDEPRAQSKDKGSVIVTDVQEQDPNVESSALKNNTDSMNIDIRDQNCEHGADHGNKDNHDSISQQKNAYEDFNLNKKSLQKCEWCLRNAQHGSLTAPFRKLETLCVSETLLGKWADLEALAKFPKLTLLRVKDISLLCHLTMEERRKLFLALLPKITSLNGSEVSDDEREKAERHFLRFFAKMKHKPTRYFDLVDKHGKLKPLVEVDLGFGFQEWARLGLVYKGIAMLEEVVHVIEPVGKLRQFISTKLLLPMRSFRMYHFPCGEGHGNSNPQLEELRLDSLPMSRFDFMDGDEIHIDDI